MEVQLIDYTGAGSSDPAAYAASRLIFTKSTRLELKPGLLKEIEGWPKERVVEELKYMANTIPSSWEFLDYTFLISGVSRAFTHQFVRSRHGSYAQQTMRVLNMEHWNYVTGPSIANDLDLCRLYSEAMDTIDDRYKALIGMGAKIEDARGILPTNICTNIIAKFNMRTLSEMFRKRESERTQGEYRDVIVAMKAAVIDVHPFCTLFFNRNFDVAARELQQEVLNLKLPYEQQTKMIKLIDQMRLG